MLQEGNESCMRLLYYPPFGAPAKPGVTRCGEHADYGTFTLLAQDCEGGLEVMKHHETKHNTSMEKYVQRVSFISIGETDFSFNSNKSTNKMQQFHKFIT